ncbi:hypothetical protein PROFUN_06262 [Planoprotostelium fungivorum]|uniref:Uncharacterized protein n=1 Tax=Planoprotostelium fungivorum TaxID=1890364 RepID=A0A2P6NE75_9EUKA|nr:hypothetical protein PROFUN_06262 [Planoprotostelium fungivorum]
MVEEYLGRKSEFWGLGQEREAHEPHRNVTVDVLKVADCRF